MKTIVNGSTLIEMTDFPYSSREWQYGCTKKDHDLLHSILFTFNDPDLPDGDSWLMDFEGIKEWYDTTVPEEEKLEYECPTIYEYLECEIGRYVTPIKGVKES